MLHKATGAVLGLLTGLPVGVADGGSPVLASVIALLSGTLGATGFDAWRRRRTGEGPARAAHDLADAASRLVDGAESLTAPMRSENARLWVRIAELERKNAEKGELNGTLALELAETKADLVRCQVERDNERHRHQNEVAACEARRAALEIELDTLRVRAGTAPDRRLPSG